MMTESEAIEYMRSYRMGRGCKPRYPDDILYEAFTVTINALEEIQKYRAIGTVEECREAVEKQKPKPCEFYGDEEDGKLLCPNCEKDLYDLQECGFNDCPYCGQAVTL